VTLGRPSARKRAPPAAVADLEARLFLVLLCLSWGFTWPAMKIALNGLAPLGMRTITACLGALTLFLVCLAKRRSFRIPDARAWGHVVVASLLNVVGFSLFSAFALMAAATSRVAILTYTLPIWTVLLAWLVLNERPNRFQAIAIVLCACGLAILIYPLAAAGIPLGALFAVGSALSWAAGTVYLKWARIGADPMGVASWQLTIAFFVIAGCMFAFDGRLDLRHAHASALIGVAFAGIVGNGIAYGLWFAVVERVSAATASLGILGIPVIGVLASVVILGDRPTVTDMIGFALIFAASVCVLVTPQAPATRPKPMP
jgi:drug/metabolite transporter (DMT)-like permease